LTVDAIGHKVHSFGRQSHGARQTPSESGAAAAAQAVAPDVAPDGTTIGRTGHTRSGRSGR